jgi:hypothetical protein
MAHPYFLRNTNSIDLSQEDMDGFLVQAAIDEGYTKIVIVDRDIEGMDIINWQLPDDVDGDDEEDRLGVLCVYFSYSYEEPSSDFERIMRLDHQKAVIKMLIKQFGQAHKAVANNEGSEYGEIVRDYHRFTLQECHDLIDYELRVIFIPGPPKSVGQEFCKRHHHCYYWRTRCLQNSSYWVEDYDLYRTLRKAWARHRNTPSTKYPAGWGKWRGEEYARSLSIAGGGTRVVILGEEMSSLAEEDPANVCVGHGTVLRKCDASCRSCKGW